MTPIGHKNLHTRTVVPVKRRNKKTFSTILEEVLPLSIGYKLWSTLVRAPAVVLLGFTRQTSATRKARISKGIAGSIFFSSALCWSSSGREW